MPASSQKTTRRRPIQERSRSTVEAILEAAAQVFEQRGLAGATTDRIAARAGVSVGTLYQYFPGKEALLLALATRHVEEEIARVTRWVEALPDPVEPGPGLEARLGALVGDLVARHRQRPRLARMMLEEAPSTPALDEVLTRWEDTLAARIGPLLGRLSPNGPPRPVAPWIVIHLVQGLVHHYVVHPPPGVTEAELVEEIQRLLLGYLRPGG